MQYVLAGSFMDETGFTGEVTIEIPMLNERVKYQLDMAAKVEKEGQAAYAVCFAEVAQKHVVSVNLKHLATGEEIKERDDLFFLEDTANLVFKVGAAVVRGKLLGKK